jgi:hypothetical protein
MGSAGTGPTGRRNKVRKSSQKLALIKSPPLRKNACGGFSLSSSIEGIREQIPPAAELRERLKELSRERTFLRELLKLAEKRDAAKSTAPDRRAATR